MAELARNFAVVAAGLVVLFDLIGFLSEAEDIGDARYDLLDALIVVAYSSPALLVDLSPFIVMLGTLAAFANLDARSEVTALRAAGESRAWFVTTATMASAVFMMCIGAVETIARPAHLEASLLRMYETAKTGNPLKDTGFWARSGSTYVNVENIENAQHPTGIRIYDFDDEGAITGFRRAVGASVDSAHAWRLEQVIDKRYASGAPEAISTLETTLWAPIWPSENALYSLTVTSLSLVELLDSAAGASNPSESTTLATHVELWRRIALPIAGIAYTAFACAFALSLRGRGGKSLQLAIGAAAALLLYLSEQVTVNAGILAGVPVALVSILPSAVVIAVALALLRRAP